MDARSVKLRITTWNVLHRVHAVNWGEAPVAAFPDERVRIDAIASRVAAWLAADVDVVCLQEVSGDQLARLRSAVPATSMIFDHRYPRLPRRRDGRPAGLDDASEHLVTLVKAPPATRREARTFETDPGKGLLAVGLDRVVVVNTHVTFGDRRTAQLESLARTVDGAPAAIVAGDFNAPADVVRAAFGPSAAISDVEGQGPTRIATAEHGGKTIDHVVVFGARLETATVLPSEGLSDHHPVTAQIAHV